MIIRDWELIPAIKKYLLLSMIVVSLIFLPVTWTGGKIQPA